MNTLYRERSKTSPLVSLLEDGLEVRLELVVEERLVPQHLLIGHDNIRVNWKKGSIDNYCGMLEQHRQLRVYYHQVPKDLIIVYNVY